MIQYVIRPLKRFAVLVPGIIIAYVSVFNIFPYFDQQLPLGIAVLVTYIIVAYLLIPALLRLWRIVRPTKHLPLYCITPDGFASDPLNIGLLGTRREVIQSMERAGWYLAEPHTLRNLLRHGLSLVLGWDYPNAPVSSLFLFGRKQDLAFEIPIEGIGQRHHVRFWATTYEKKTPLTVHAIHWHHRREHVQTDQLLWVGAASLDVGIGFIRHNLQLTHMIAPDTNKERQLIVDQLKSQRLVEKKQRVELGKPYRLINRVVRGYLQTDGKMDIITLKTTAPARAQPSRYRKQPKPQSKR